MKIVVLDGYTLNPGDLSWDDIKNIGETIVYHRTKENEIIQRVGDAEIIFTNKTVLTKDILAQLPNIKYIGVLATGFNVVDLEAAKMMGITVTNIPDYGTETVAQHVFALLLEICNNTGRHNEEVQQGAWSKSIDFCFWKYPLIELSGKKFGIIGTGRIGKVTATIAQAFGMKVLAYSTHPNKSLESSSFKYVELDELFCDADIISLHCPLTESTKGIINESNIKKMKDGVILINTSRGPLVIEEDLAKYLKNGKIYAAAVDVLNEEPPVKNNPLIGLENCYVTPHIAWAAKESRKRLMTIAADNLKQFLKGTPINVVNK